MTAVEARVANQSRNILLAYVLWFFLGVFGAHRFYLGKMGTAILQLLFTLSVFGAIITVVWWVIDAFLIPGLIEDDQERIRAAAKADLT